MHTWTCSKKFDHIHERGAIIRAVYHVRERRFISTWIKHPINLKPWYLKLYWTISSLFALNSFFALSSWCPVHLIFKVFYLALNIKNCRQIFGRVYLPFALWMGQIQSKMIYIFVITIRAPLEPDLGLKPLSIMNRRF